MAVDMMEYDVTYQVGNEERTARVIAPHAAGAAEHITSEHEDGEEHFELLCVSLLEPPEQDQSPPAEATS